MSQIDIENILTPPKTVAVVGLSDKQERPSYEVASYLLEKGFTIIPVNPMIKEFKGIPSYNSIVAIPKNIQIDIVDVFRRSEEVLPIVQEIIATGLKPQVIWMQEGVVSEEAKRLAEQNGMTVIMDKCMMKLHKSLN